jgi:hypothetical protein
MLLPLASLTALTAVVSFTTASSILWPAAIVLGALTLLALISWLTDDPLSIRRNRR